MLFLDILAERRIEEALARGDLDNLPGQGRPLDLDDEDPLWPEEVRMARRILRNAGYSDEDPAAIAWRRPSIHTRRSPS